MKNINLQKIVAVKGQAGLFHLVNYNPKGFFLQPFEGGVIRFVSNEKGKVLALGNVDLRLANDESINLLEVFRLMEKETISEVHTIEALIDYFHKIADLDKSIAPTHLQKVVKWYSMIVDHFGSNSMVNEEVDGLTII
ncbi:hypothetical protein [Ekhidna sp.]